MSDWLGRIFMYVCISIFTFVIFFVLLSFLTVPRIYDTYDYDFCQKFKDNDDAYTICLDSKGITDDEAANKDLYIRHREYTGMLFVLVSSTMCGIIVGVISFVWYEEF